MFWLVFFFLMLMWFLSVLGPKVSLFTSNSCIFKIYIFLPLCLFHLLFPKFISMSQVSKRDYYFSNHFTISFSLHIWEEVSWSQIRFSVHTANTVACLMLPVVFNHFSYWAPGAFTSFISFYFIVLWDSYSFNKYIWWVTI